MIIKKGIVIEINNKEAYVMLSNGDFSRLKIKNDLPRIGEEYEGEEVLKKPNYFNKIAMVASITFVLLSSTGAYAYFTPVSTVVLNEDSGIKVGINRFNRVVSVTPLNEAGEKVVKELNIKNKNIDDAMVEVIDQVKKNINIEVKGSKLNTEKIKEKLKNEKLDGKIKIKDKEENRNNKDSLPKKDKTTKENENIKKNNNVNKNIENKYKNNDNSKNRRNYNDKNGNIRNKNNSNDSTKNGNKDNK